MAEVLDVLDVSRDVRQDLQFLNLEEGVDAGGEEHVGSIRLSIQTRLLQHYRYHSAEVNQGG